MSDKSDISDIRYVKCQRNKISDISIFRYQIYQYSFKRYIIIQISDISDITSISIQIYQVSEISDIRYKIYQI